MAAEDLKARIRGQYDPTTLSHVEVPEWDTVIYFRPLNLEERSKLNHWRQASNTERGLEVFAKTVVLKALDEAGKPIFGQNDIKFLMTESDPDVVMRLSTQLVSAATEVDQKKD